MHINEVLSKAKETAEYIKSKKNENPEIAVILGSGLGNFADNLFQRVEIAYTEIPNFPESTVAGHDGKIILGKIGNKNIIVMKGRFHYYEGYSMLEVTFAVRVFALLGVKTLIVTNAAGGVNQTYNVGDLMVIRDHIKFFDDSPLRGKNIGEFGVRFPGMLVPYLEDFRKLFISIGKEKNVDVKEGIYFFMPGPSFETMAEINAIRMLGGDAVGMSTAPEVITAIHSGMNVLGVSCITNVVGKEASHEEVIEAANNASSKFTEILIEFVNNI